MQFNTSKIVAVATITAALIASPGHAQEFTLGFKAEAKALYLTRSAPTNRPILSTFAGVGTGNVMNANDISPGFEAGLQVRLHADVTPLFGVEASGFFLNEFSEKLSFQGGPHSIEGVVPYTAFQPGTDVNWKSSIRGFQANVTYAPTDGLQLIAGIRSIVLDESLSLTFPPVPATAIVSNYAAANRMFGPQIGVRAETDQLFAGVLDPFNLGIEVFGGALFNSISTSSNGLGGIQPNAASGDETSFFVQAALDAEYEITPGLSAGIGYQVMWINNVAQVTDQVGTTQVLGGGFTPSTSIRTSSVLYHGPQATLTFTLE